ncbi:MAG: glutaredoxin family protein [Dehalococcoidia bacterium]|jgi:glutaredoxin|nr:glutaredoxin family protein [Dehalococcoidia bacterium]
MTPGKASARYEVVLYSRPGCHLCDDARRALEQLQREPGGEPAFELREVDIESDPALERRFMIEIPVIEVDGNVVTQAPVDLRAVRAALE